MTEKGRVVLRYEARDGRIIPMVRISPDGRVRRLRKLRCVVCGKAFFATRADARTDSGACRAKLWRMRRRDREYLIRMQKNGNPLFQQSLWSTRLHEA